MGILEVVGRRHRGRSSSLCSVIVIVLGRRHRARIRARSSMSPWMLGVVVVHPQSSWNLSVIVVAMAVVCHQPSRGMESIGGGRRQGSTIAEFEFGLLIGARVAEMTLSVTVRHSCEVFSQDYAQ